MSKEKDNKFIEQTNEQDNKFTEEEANEKKKHTGIKVTAAVAAGIVATGLVAGALIPNVKDRVANGVEDLIYKATGLPFDINGDFNPGGEASYYLYGPQYMDIEEQPKDVEGFQ